MISRPAIPQHNLQTLSDDSLMGFRMLFWDEADHEYFFEEPHRHGFCEMLIFDIGGGTHDIDFTTYKIRNRSMHFVRPENVHMVVRKKGSSGCSLLFHYDYFTDDLLQQLSAYKTGPVIQFDTQTFPYVQNLLSCIKYEYTNKKPGYNGVIHKLMESLMLLFLRELASEDPQKKSDKTAPDFVSRFVRLVHKNYMLHLSVEQYAQNLNISVKHLIAECKSHMGKTPLRYIEQHLIAEAKRLLQYTTLTVKEIAYKLGFEEPSNFSKYFKRITKYTPTVYREHSR